MEESNSISHILIIDDDPDDSEIFKDVLYELDSRILLTTLYHCYDIITVLNKLESVPDILFIDVHLPGEDGLKCIETIKATPKYSTLKIVIYCGVLSQHMIDKALEKGADSYFLKPTTIGELHGLLKKILNLQPL